MPAKRNSGLRNDPPLLLPALKLRFADVETAITDLETNNTVVLRNLRDIAREGY